jgi:hypothetical protein
MMFQWGPPARLAAMIDWELSTIGDPMIDMGWFTGGMRDERFPDLNARGGLNNVDNFPTKQELARLYYAGTGRNIEDFDFCSILAGFKAGCLLEYKVAQAAARILPQEVGEFFSRQVDASFKKPPRSSARNARLWTCCSPNRVPSSTEIGCSGPQGPPQTNGGLFRWKGHSCSCANASKSPRHIDGRSEGTVVPLIRVTISQGPGTLSSNRGPPIWWCRGMPSANDGSSANHPEHMRSNGQLGRTTKIFGKWRLDLHRGCEASRSSR